MAFVAHKVTVRQVFFIEDYHSSILAYCSTIYIYIYIHKRAGKSLARLGRKQATATEDIDVRISYLLS